MTYPEILARVEATTGHAPRPSGGGHEARCPAHPDKTPSLTLSPGADGRTLAHCHRGCPFDAVAGALGLAPADFYERPQAPAWDPKADGFEVTARYRYVDSGGALLFEKERREPRPGHPARGHDKAFVQRRPDPDRPGRWLYRLGEVARPLYRLPEVEAAVRDGRTVFVVEGEKDADALAALGLVATCNDGGAGKWGPQHSAALTGARVAVVPDNDGPGRAHADAVARALAPVVASVVVVALGPLPDGRPMPHKGDVSDWLDAGGAADALGALAREAPLFDPGAEAPRRPAVLDIRTGAEWMEAAARMPTPRPLWGPLWFEGETTILFSETNAGKSVAAVQVADAIARGRGAFGLPCGAAPQDVLYLDFELSAKQYERRYSRDFADPYAFAPGFHRAELDPDALADEDAFDVAVREAIEAAVEARGYGVVVVDNLTFIGRQSQEARDALPLMRALHRLKRKHGLSMLVLGHTPKRDGSRPLTLNDLGGSRHLANFADAVVGLGKSAREPDVRYLKQLKVRSAELEYHAEHVLSLRLEKPGNFLGFRSLDLGPESAHLREMGDDERAQRDAAILDLRADGLSYREIGERLGVSHMAAKRAVDRAGGVTPVTPSGGVTPVTSGGDGAALPLAPGSPVLTPRGAGTLTARPEGGEASVDVGGLPFRFAVADLAPVPPPTPRSSHA